MNITRTTSRSLPKPVGGPITSSNDHYGTRDPAGDCFMTGISRTTHILTSMVGGAISGLVANQNGGLDASLSAGFKVQGALNTVVGTSLGIKHALHIPGSSPFSVVELGVGYGALGAVAGAAKTVLAESVASTLLGGGPVASAISGAVFGFPLFTLGK